MARIIRLPNEKDLPPGTVRDFAILLHYLYRRAHRPALREISDAIRRDDDLNGTASPETVRRMLTGASVPAHWGTVEAVYLTLCYLARLDPYRHTVKHNNKSLPVAEHIEEAWHSALEDPDYFYAQSSYGGGYGGSSDGGFGPGSSDEPPF
jgi:hypothetical protein